MYVCIVDYVWANVTYRRRVDGNEYILQMYFSHGLAVWLGKIKLLSNT